MLPHHETLNYIIGNFIRCDSENIKINENVCNSILRVFLPKIILVGVFLIKECLGK